jgi:hypothetical protein
MQPAVPLDLIHEMVVAQLRSSRELVEIARALHTLAGSDPDEQRKSQCQQLARRILEISDTTVSAADRVGTALRSFVATTSAT